MSKFPCSLIINITSHSMKNLAFHSLLRLEDNCCTNSHFLTYTFLLKRFGEFKRQSVEETTGRSPNCCTDLAARCRGISPLLFFFLKQGTVRVPRSNATFWNDE